MAARTRVDPTTTTTQVTKEVINRKATTTRKSRTKAQAKVTMVAATTR